jgi:hypothetical protein
MPKRICLYVSLCLVAFAIGGLLAQQVQINPADTMAASVGRMRPIQEVPEQLPGLHNPVHYVQRRPTASCAECQVQAAELRQLQLEQKRDAARAHNPAFAVLRFLHLSRRFDDRALRAKRVEYAALLERPGNSTVVMDVWSHNLVVNAGLNWLADIMGKTTTPSVNTQCNYIALTNTAITPGASDTTLSGEITSNGLARAQGTYTHTANATTYTISNVFTATAPQAAQAGAVLTAASGGTMCFEDTFTAASLQTNDTLTVTWTVTI